MVNFLNFLTFGCMKTLQISFGCIVQKDKKRSAYLKNIENIVELCYNVTGTLSIKFISQRWNMILFKIISDPYKREIRFETVDSDTEEAIPVTESDNSDLVSDELIHGFFPYNVKRIIDEIMQ